MRIAHATDIHWMTTPPLRRLSGKRLLGSANLYLGGRRHRFSEEVQSRLVDHIVDLSPDLVVITGDLTAQALPEEFEKARTALAPVTGSLPTLISPGNHDVYTQGSMREQRFYKYFSHWAGRGPAGVVGRLEVGSTTVLGLDPNRPTSLHASGLLPDEQLTELAEILTEPGLAQRSLVLALHYPVLSPSGAIYDNPRHGLRNARALIDVLRQAPKRPDLILHGHIHHGYHRELDLGDAKVPTHNCGSSGYVRNERQGRGAAMNLYTLTPGEAVQVERFCYNGTHFMPEPGGAYATEKHH